MVNQYFIWGYKHSWTLHSYLVLFICWYEINEVIYKSFPQLMMEEYSMYISESFKALENLNEL